jgi:hypothetical protein
MLYLIYERRINKDENERVTDGFGKKKNAGGTRSIMLICHKERGETIK